MKPTEQKNNRLVVCPTCGSGDTTKLSHRESGKIDEVTLHSVRRCATCGALFEPAARPVYRGVGVLTIMGITIVASIECLRKPLYEVFDGAVLSLLDVGRIAFGIYIVVWGWLISRSLILTTETRLINVPPGDECRPDI